MRVSRERLTGKLIEMQEPGAVQAMRGNAERAGYAAADIEILEITPSEWAAIREDLRTREAATRPDRRGFEGALKTVFPDDLLTLRKVLILFWLVEHEEWPRVEKVILALKASSEITSGSPTAQYEKIKAEVAAKRIPVTLP